MATLDGYNVNVGDSVFDMVWGAGTVEQIMVSDRFTVRFGPARVGVFSSSGVNARYSGRTLFWKNPVLVPPTKDDRRWTLIQALVPQIVAQVRSWAGP